MTLSAGTGYNAVGREIFGFAPQIAVLPDIPNARAGAGYAGGWLYIRFGHDYLVMRRSLRR